MVAEDFAAGLRRLVDPATASQYAQVIDVIVNAPDIVAGKKPVDSLGCRGARREHGGHHARQPGALSTGAHGASVHRAAAPPLARETRRALRARRASRCRTARSCSTEWLQGSYISRDRNTHYWNNAANKLDGVKYLQIADENAELRAYRAGELHCTEVVPRGQFDWIKENLARGAARLAAAQHLLLRLQSRSRAVQGQSEAAPGAVDGHRSRAAGELRAARGRAAGVRLGAARRVQLHPAVFRLRRDARWPSASPTRASCCAEAGYSRDKPLRFELRYNTGEVHTKVAVAIASMWKEALGVEAQLAAVEFKSLLQDIDRARRRHVSGCPGSATTTMPTPSCST